jgi:hypothetical protein
MDFNTDNRDSTVFSGAEGVEFWVPSEGGIPDVVFRIGDIMRVSGARERSSSGSSSEGQEESVGMAASGEEPQLAGQCKPQPPAAPAPLPPAGWMCQAAQPGRVCHPGFQGWLAAHLFSHC